MARRSTQRIETPNEQVGQDHPRDMPVDGEASLEPQRIQVVDGPDWENKAAELAFMEEPVEVMVHPSTDPNSNHIVEVWCNGRSQRFLRGQPMIVRRKYIEVLARSKITRYTQEPYKDGNGAAAIRNVPQTASLYPFSVVSDKSPRGAAWLRKVLAEA